MACCPLGAVVLDQQRRGPENSPRDSTSPPKREELREDEWMTGLEEDWMTEEEESRPQDRRQVVECPPKGFKEYLPKKRKTTRRKKATAPRAPGDSLQEVLPASLQESRYRAHAPSAPCWPSRTGPRDRALQRGLRLGGLLLAGSSRAPRSTVGLLVPPGLPLESPGTGQERRRRWSSGSCPGPLSWETISR